MTTAPSFRFDVQRRRWRDRHGRFVRASRARRKVSRIDRAVELVALGCVVPERGGCTVISANGARFYRVALDRCDCPDASYRGSICKHRLALAVAGRQLGALMTGAAEDGAKVPDAAGAGAGIGGGHITRDRDSAVSRFRPAPTRAVRC